jgi:hypothetical protein
MAHISLVLPFALPAPEFAADLVRALEAPALAALLSRTAGHMFRPLEATARVLPHELWIARALGLATARRPASPPAPCAATGSIRSTAPGSW